MSLRSNFRSTLALAATLFLSATAHAQAFRTYVASNGLDTNPCTLQQPCRLIPAALNAVASGGEIWMLNSANYNSATVNITKSVTILAVPGALGSVVAVGGPAISIATADINVKLRNLVIVPLPGAGGLHGVSMTAGASLAVQNCLLENLVDAAIVVSTPAVVRIADTTIRDNFRGVVLSNGARAVMVRAMISRSSDIGILLFGTGGTTIIADIAESTLDGNPYGVFLFSQLADDAMKVSIRDSKVVQNSQIGLLAQATGGAPISLSASNNIVSNNGIGIRGSGATSKVWASGNTVSDNVTGLFQVNSATFESAGNNAVRNNGADVTGTVTVPVPAMR